MFTRTYRFRDHKLLVKSYSNRLSYIEEMMRKSRGFEDLVMCIVEPHSEEVFYAPPTPYTKPREIAIGSYNFRKGEWLPSMVFYFPINEAIDRGFDFSLLPNPTKEEIEIANSHKK